MQSKLTYTKMTQKNTYFLLHGAPYKSNISSWQPPRYCSEFIFLQMETGCQLVPKMFSVTFLSGFCPQTNNDSHTAPLNGTLRQKIFLSLRSTSSSDMKGWARQKRLLLAVKPADRQNKKKKSILQIKIQFDKCFP